MDAGQPVSVVISKELRTRLEREAARRSLKLSTVLRALAAERLRELEEVERMTEAEEWQRAQAWGSWERHREGSNPEVSWDEVEAVFDRAARPAGSVRRRSSSKTSKGKSRG